MERASIRLICFALAFSAFPFCLNASIPTEIENETGQSIKAEAMRWFHFAVKEKNRAKKIEAYQAALRIEPDFVEALYNLGLLYKQERDFAQAEVYFSRAENAFNFRGRNDLKMRILYDLAHAYKKQSKLNETKEALLRALKSAHDKNTRATISLELARTYFSGSQFDLALQIIEKSIAENPGNAAFLRNFAKTVRQAMQIETLYGMAADALAEKKYDDALPLLEKVYQISPDYKDAARKLAEARNGAADQKKAEVLNRLYYEGAGFESQGQFLQAIERFETILAQAPAYKDAAQKLKKNRRAQAKADKLAEQRESQKETAYEAGLRAMHQEKWDAAAKAFRRVAALDSDFRNVKGKLDEALHMAKKSSAINPVSRHYADGLEALNNEDMLTALTSLQKAYDLDPDYRNAGELLRQVKELSEMGLESADSERTPGVFSSANADHDSLYQSALIAMDEEKWLTAVAMLEKVRMTAGAYRDVEALLATARRQLPGAGALASDSAEPQEPQAGEGNQTLILSGIIASLLVFPVLGFLAFSPSVRAKLFLLSGKNDASSRIYERLIAKNPGRLKFYPILANLYLLAGKKDEQAMKIYRMVLQLNLETTRRDDIQSFVARNFLTDGTTPSSDAIEVLESALKDGGVRHQR